MLAVPERVKTVLALLTRCAEAGETCPDNIVIANAIGARSSATGSNVVSLLEATGLIKVERSSYLRVVTICATGKRTKGSIKRTRHYGSGSHSPSGRLRRTDRHWSAADDALLMERMSLGDDFEQAGRMVGVIGDVAAARFDELAAGMGWQAA